ncbi:MAG: hypothetical protein DRI39_09595 [Chloroflexi bacterium]|nr:MAG: hypothetical protein DRI39_09595 [Chloroflexota bacterium]
MEYSECCGKGVGTEMIPDERLVERSWRAVWKILQKRQVQSIEEGTALITRLLEEGNLPDWVPETPLEKAQEMVYQALAAPQREERIRLAKKALRLSRDCIDAYVVLAEEAARGPEQALEWYLQGVDAARRLLRQVRSYGGRSAFLIVPEVEPARRAARGAADCFFQLGRYDSALEYYGLALHWKPGHDDGIRYDVLRCLMEKREIDAAETWLGQFPEDMTAERLYTLALIAFIRHGDGFEARLQLQAAIEQNRSVVPYLTGRIPLPLSLPPDIAAGSVDEAALYAVDYLRIWLTTPGALEWLQAATKDL